jgi:multiple sugar transport system permease protein
MRRLFTYSFLTIASLLIIYPVLYLVLGAFTTPERFFEAALLPIPNTLTLGALARLWDALRGAYLVTLVRVAFYIVVTLAVGVLGGYFFSRVRFPGRDLAFLLLLSGLVMPSILMIVPNFIQMARWPLAGGNDLWGQGDHGFIGEWPVLFLYGWVPPFAIFLLKQTFDMLPIDYEEAARIDGAGLFTLLFRVYGPMLTPALAALAIVTFLGVWNDYLWPSLTIYGNPTWYPISFRVAGIGSGRASPGAFLLIMFALWPPALVYLVLQRYFVQGLVASGLKG